MTSLRVDDAAARHDHVHPSLVVRSTTVIDAA